MISNTVIRSVRYMLNLSDEKLLDVFKLGEGNVTMEALQTFLKKEDEEGFVECDDKSMHSFLNGVIYLRRGKDPSRPPMPFEIPTNNVVLKKLRVAFELKDEDILEILFQAGFKISKTELSAFFRKVGHQNYRECGDQFLRNFLKGLTNRVRK